MEQTFMTFFIVVGVVIVTCIVLGGWVLGRIARAIGLMLGLIPPRPVMMAPPMRRVMSPSPMRPVPPPGYIQCRVPGCRHANPMSAKFCRHCGHAFPMREQQLPVIWPARN
jgi:hypothetical protein